jgi:uncharacterized protein (TIGR02996 family)
MREAEAFERAIIEHPDDLSSYSAYADWLQEHDDPRGEFIAVQLALEDESRPKREREALKKREAELLATYERGWLGELAPFLLDRDETQYYQPNPEYRWLRGCLWALKVDFMTMRSAQALAAAPGARFLRELRVGNTASYYELDGGVQPPARVRRPPGVSRHWELLELIGAPCLRSLRFFQMGDEEPPEDGWCDCHTDAFGLQHVIATMPRIEELHLLCTSYHAGQLFKLPNLTELRVLRMYALGDPHNRDHYEIPIPALARNPALGNLTHLLLHPHFAHDRSFLPLPCVVPVFRSPHLKKLTHLQLRLSDMGDAGIREIINSGILKQLKWLDLRHGCITDEGARLLAACPDAQRLERIDLSRNAVTATGLLNLRNANINAVANNPLTQAELDDREYLREGDFE